MIVSVVKMEQDMRGVTVEDGSEDVIGSEKNKYQVTSTHRHSSVTHLL